MGRRAFFFIVSLVFICVSHADISQKFNINKYMANIKNKYIKSNDNFTHSELSGKWAGHCNGDDSREYTIDIVTTALGAKLNNRFYYYNKNKTSNEFTGMFTNSKLERLQLSEDGTVLSFFLNIVGTMDGVLPISEIEVDRLSLDGSVLKKVSHIIYYHGDEKISDAETNCFYSKNFDTK